MWKLFLVSREQFWKNFFCFGFIVTELSDLLPASLWQFHLSQTLQDTADTQVKEDGPWSYIFQEGFHDCENGLQSWLASTEQTLPTCVMPAHCENIHAARDHSWGSTGKTALRPLTCCQISLWSCLILLSLNHSLIFLSEDIGIQEKYIDINWHWPLNKKQ